MEFLLILALFLVLMVIGAPIGTALGVSAVATILYFDLGAEMLGVNFASGIASFPLLAIPFFVLAGVILQRAGIAAHIANFFELLVGRATGGLSIVAVLTCMFWGAMSGSGPATTAAVGMILLTPMLKNGYDKAFSGATIANASDLSHHHSAVHRLHHLRQHHLGVGVRPVRGGHHPRPADRRGDHARGLVHLVSARLPGGWSAGAAWPTCSRRCASPSGRSWPRWSSWAASTPGIFTPTEAAVVAVFYSLFVAVVIYRSIGWRDLVEILVEASVTSSVIMFIVAFAGIFTWAASVTGVIDTLAAFIIRISPNAVVMIVLVNVLLFALGMILDAISISYLLMPILIPVLAAFHVDPVFYGVIFISALAIGQATPPVGVNLFTAANLVGCEVDEIAREAIPYVAMDFVVLVIISLIPALSLFLPEWAGLYTP